MTFDRERHLQLCSQLVAAHLRQQNARVNQLLAVLDQEFERRKTTPRQRTGVTEAIGPTSKRIKQSRWMKDNLTNQADAPEYPDEWDWSIR